MFGVLWVEVGLDGVWEAGHPGVRQGVPPCGLLRLAEPGRSKRGGHTQDPQRNYGLKIPVEKFYGTIDRLNRLWGRAPRPMEIRSQRPSGQAPSLLSPGAACDGAQQTQESRQDPSQVSQVSQVSS